ncbi:polysaccharide deacetylase family protein [uncultured Thiodictyon sp.]|uniref:polysaccharide deacetylase family protein n=1 Tax=uncultured Thiodictyon sp. TaxID=1846217 RepID=UPI0025F92AB9|nr:polysaccharide deacetylase family protein [uncultured Thiodictyon sp.]
MKPNIMTVVQCWDDGVTTDVRLIDILRRHGTKATFNLNAGLHEKQRKSGWIHRGTEVARLGWDDMKAVYDGFTIANHSLTHPRLEQLPIETARREVAEGRDRLQQFFGQPVSGFAYPFGSYSEAAMAAVRETGHPYARTTRQVAYPFPPENAMAFHPCCHFLAPDLWARYEQARTGGVFYFWGHSYEMITPEMWAAFEAVIARISNDRLARWGEIAELFDETTQVTISPIGGLPGAAASLLDSGL